MEIIKNSNVKDLEIIIKGRLDTTTAPNLEREIKDNIKGVTNLILNLQNLEYISSAGLRILLSAQKQMNKQGQMLIKNPNEVVMEVFEVTGFVNFLNIQ